MSADRSPNTSDGRLTPHRRRNPLTGDWVLVSPHRTLRPWSGQVESIPAKHRPAYDRECYLCPGNSRAQGHTNPLYEGAFVFDNDFAALTPESPLALAGSFDPSDPLFASESVTGACRVMCFSPRHDLSLAEMDEPSVLGVIEAWTEETAALGARYPWVQVFENKGTAMGCSNLHPHGQLWASSFIPNEGVKEDAHQRGHADRTGENLLVSYARREIDRAERVVEVNAHWVAVVPYWAVWPFEALIVPRRQVARLPDLEPAERLALAALLRGVLGRYDRLFDVPFPYSMGWHGAPFGTADALHWQLHAHIYPPLLRSATVRKHMVGYEMLAAPQRDLTAEDAAGRLRELAVLHAR